MPGLKSKSVKKDLKIIMDEFLEDGEMFENEKKFFEEMNLNKWKKINEEEKMEKKEIKEEKMEVEEKKEEKMDKEYVKEEKIEKEELKPKVKEQCTSLYNKYKRKREGEEDT
jgi:hypothetical protein